jgi:hypothetical protein
MKIVRICYTILAYVSCGFYVHPSAWCFECPGHPRDAEEIQRDENKHQRDRDPGRYMGDEKQREQYEKDTRDGKRDNWAKKD